MPDGLNLRLLDVLGAAADALVDDLDGGRVRDLARDRRRPHPGRRARPAKARRFRQGQGYLITDYPQTAQVLETREPRTLTLDDADVDAGEAEILRGLGFGSLVMVPLDINGDAWGLVEVYRRDRRPFTSADVARAVELSRIT